MKTGFAVSPQRDIALMGKFGPRIFPPDAPNAADLIARIGESKR
jgi:hypothetical protein